MSHNINSMFYAGETPWHNLGTKVKENLSSVEVIKAAGLDWTVEKQPLFLASIDGSDNPVPFKGKYITRRMDTGAPLGVVGDRYHVLQNRDAFSFFDAIVGEKAAMYHTAGALGDGERTWILAKVPKDIVVKGVDVVEKYLLLVNSHNGKSTVTVMMTPIRVVCQNTLIVALEGSGRKAKLSHTPQLGFRVKRTREELGLIINTFDVLSQKFDRLASKPCTYPEFDKYARALNLYEDPSEVSEQSKAFRIMEDLSTRFEHGRGNDEKKIRGTWWTAYNAITEFVDYSPLFGRAKDADSRATSILFDKGAGLKEQALTAALSKVK